jgi:hypothetical protein
MCDLFGWGLLASNLTPVEVNIIIIIIIRAQGSIWIFSNHRKSYM